MKVRKMEHQRLRAFVRDPAHCCCCCCCCCVARCVCVLCVLYGSHSNRVNRCDRGPLCSAYVRVLWVCVSCGHTPQDPEHRYFVDRSRPQQEQAIQQSTTHTAPSTVLKATPCQASAAHGCMTLPPSPRSPR